MTSAIVAMAIAPVAVSAFEMKDRRPQHTIVLPRPRDGDVAVQEELDAARQAGTRTAYDLFLSRHGDHPLAATARRERAHLTR